MAKRSRTPEGQDETSPKRTGRSRVRDDAPPRDADVPHRGRDDGDLTAGDEGVDDPVER